MDAREDANQVIELAVEAIAPIEQELHRRLSVEIAEPDALALESALLKAFMRGVSAGSSEAAELLIDQAGLLDSRPSTDLATAAQLGEPTPRIDPWAERYGAGG